MGVTQNVYGFGAATLYRAELDSEKKIIILQINFHDQINKHFCEVKKDVKAPPQYMLSTFHFRDLVLC